MSWRNRRSPRKTINWWPQTPPRMLKRNVREMNWYQIPIQRACLVSKGRFPISESLDFMGFIRLSQGAEPCKKWRATGHCLGIGRIHQLKSPESDETWQTNLRQTANDLYTGLAQLVIRVQYSTGFCWQQWQLVDSYEKWSKEPISSRHFRTFCNLWDRDWEAPESGFHHWWHGWEPGNSVPVAYQELSVLPTQVPRSLAFYESVEIWAWRRKMCTGLSQSSRNCTLCRARTGVLFDVQEIRRTIPGAAWGHEAAGSPKTIPSGASLGPPILELACNMQRWIWQVSMIGWWRMA